jgi:hypothetical protein
LRCPPELYLQVFESTGRNGVILNCRIEVKRAANRRQQYSGQCRKCHRHPKSGITPKNMRSG